MVLKLISNLNMNVFVSIYNQEKEIKKVLLKRNECLYIELDDSVGNMKIKFREQFNIIAIMLVSLLRALSILMSSDTEMLRMLPVGFIATHISVSDKKGEIQIVYNEVFLHATEMDSAMGLVKSGSAKVEYIFDKESFEDIWKQEIFEIIITGSIYCFIFWIGLIGYLQDRIYSLAAIMGLLIGAIFLWLFMTVKKLKEPSNIEMLKTDLKNLKFDIIEN